MNCLKLSLFTCAICFSGDYLNAYQASFFKIGEVDDNSAIIWTRTTQFEKQNPADGPKIHYTYKEGSRKKIDSHGFRQTTGRARKDIFVSNTIDDDKSIDDLFLGAPGARGEIKVKYRPMGNDHWQETEWLEPHPEQDYSRQVHLHDLLPFQAYELSVLSRLEGSDDVTAELSGRFHTAPEPNDRVDAIRFIVTTCGDYFEEKMPSIYPAVADLDPHFFVHTGDIIYYDYWAKNKELADYCWQRFFADPEQGQPYSQMSTYFMKDDHETLVDDAYPGMNSEFMGDLTWEQGLEIFKYQVPMHEKTYRTIRWGKDLQVWFLEGRDYRSPNSMPDGPEKSMLGAIQKQWLKETIQASDSTFRVVITPNPIVGPDRKNKNDNLSNEGFQTEGDEIRAFLGQFENLIVITGDRHWQYASIDPKTKLREYSVGGSGKVGGWDEDDFREGVHTFLKVERGFVSVDLESDAVGATLAINHHAVDGTVRNRNEISYESGVYNFQHH